MSQSTPTLPSLIKENLLSDDDIGNPSPLSTTFTNTPKSSSANQTNTIYQDGLQGRRFLHELRVAFESADIDNKGYITESEWLTSSLRNYIQNGKLSDEDYRKYFLRIDANADGELTWNELVCYLLKDISSRDLRIDNETIRFIHKPKLPVPSRSQMHREMVQHITYCMRTGEYITLSPDSIRFWNPADLSFKRSIIEPGFFSNFCVFDNMKILAAATTKRRLLFYEMESLDVLPVEISASPSTHQIRSMSSKQAEDALRVLDSPHMPLSNIPQAICSADSLNKPNDYSLIFFIGDDFGVVEVFKLKVPMRRQGTDYSIMRIGRYKIHDGGINQISPIELLLCFASCANDNTVKFWNFIETSNNVGSFTILRTFCDSIPLLGFNFSTTQKVLMTYGSSRDGYVWAISPPRKLFKLGGHYNTIQAAADFVTTSNDKYLLTMTNRKEFRLWDSVNFRMVYEWSDPTMQRPENHYSAAMFDYGRHSLITCSAYPSKWAEDITAHVDLYELHSHNYPIVGCFFSKEFDQIITVDTICTFKVWNYKTGTLAIQHKILWDDKSSELSCSCIDCSSRRILTCTFKGNTTLWNFNSGNEIPIINLAEPSSFIRLMSYVNISSREFLIRCSWDQTIMVIMEVEKGNFELFRTFVGHKNDITAVTSFYNGLISGDIKGTIFEWVLDTNSPQECRTISSSVESLTTSSHYLYVGDGDGKLYVFLLPKLSLILELNAHDITKQYIVSYIIVDEEHDYLYTADTLGYVRKWKIRTTPKYSLEPLAIKRCNLDEITSILLIDHGDIIATCGVDKTVRIWKSETFEYIGFLHDDNSWDIDDPSAIKPEPFDVDKTHFMAPPQTLFMRRQSYMKIKNKSLSKSANKFDEIPQHQNSIIAQGNDLNNSPLGGGYNNNYNNYGNDNGNDNGQPSFSFLEAGKVINDFMQDHEYKKNRPSYQSAAIIASSKRKTFAITEPVLLQTTARPADIINDYQILASRSKPVLMENGGGGISSLGRVKRISQMPSIFGKQILRPKSNKAFRAASCNRVPLSSNIY